MASELDPNLAQALGPATAIGIVGAGAMGSGIAQVAAVAGHSVRLYDVQLDAARHAVERVLAGVDRLEKKHELDGDEAARVRERVSTVESLAGLAGCELVIEAIVEDLEAKLALFRELEPHVDERTILATNTSSLSITAIAGALRHPERLAGMHFFNPAPVMPLVEIVRGAATAPHVMETLHAIALRWGKTPVRAKSSPGFIVNRVARPFYAEALRLLQEQAADCATIDAVMRESGGFRMGPFELMDLIGNDVNYAVTRSVFDGFYGDPRFTPSVLQRDLVAAGRLGRKTGCGFYTYTDGQANCDVPNAPSETTPAVIQVYGQTSLARALAQRLAGSGVKAEAAAAHEDGRIAACDRCTIFRADGRTATARAAATGIRNTIAMDLALDDLSATRVAIAAAYQADPAALQAATGLLQAAGYAVSIVDDVPGLIVMRTVAMLANEAADAVNQGVASIAGVDLAMRKGVNYPRGPLEWADAIGISNIVKILDHLAAAYGEDRYRVSPLLRRMALANRTFTDEQGVAATQSIRPSYGLKGSA